MTAEIYPEKFGYVSQPGYAAVEGVRGAAQMGEDDRYCIDVLTQIQAIGAVLSARAA